MIFYSCCFIHICGVPELGLVIIRHFVAHLKNLSKLPRHFAVNGEDVLLFLDATCELLIVLVPILLLNYAAQALTPGSTGTVLATGAHGSLISCCTHIFWPFVCMMIISWI